jgi:hypothetical protein
LRLLGQLVITQLGSGGLLLAPLAAVEDECQQVIRWAVRRHSIHRQQRAEAEFFSQDGFVRGSLASAMPPGVPIWLVLGVNEHQAAGSVAREHVGADPFAQLLGVALAGALSQFGLTLVGGLPVRVGDRVGEVVNAVGYTATDHRVGWE